MALINTIEHKFPVEQWKIKEIDVWPFIRLEIASALHNNVQMLKAERLGKISLLLKTLKRISKCLYHEIKGFFLNWRKNSRFAEHDVDVLMFSDMAYRTKIGSKYYSKESDYFYDAFKSRGFTVQILENNRTCLNRFPRYSKTVLISMRLQFVRLFAKVTWRRSDALEEHLPEYDAFLSFLSDKPELLFLKERFKLNILRPKIYEMDACACFFKERFLESNASLALIICYYTFIGQAFCLGARRAGIRCFDIQHGITGGLHRAYGRWKNVPLNCYNTFPTGFWCWGDADVAAIQEWGKGLSPPIQLIKGGDVWMEMWFRTDLSVIVEEQKKVENFFADKSNKRIILVTLQYSDFPEILDQIIDENDEDCIWLIRSHTRLVEEGTSLLKRFKEYPYVNIKDASALPLFFLLSKVNIHITMSSSVVEFARLFSIKSVLIDLMGKEFFGHYIQSGDCYYADTAEIIRQLIRTKSSVPIIPQQQRCDSSIDKLIDLSGIKKHA